MFVDVKRDGLYWSFVLVAVEERKKFVSLLTLDLVICKDLLQKILLYVPGALVIPSIGMVALVIRSIRILVLVIPSCSGYPKQFCDVSDVDGIKC